MFSEPIVGLPFGPLPSLVEHSAASLPLPLNEQVRIYAPGSPERSSLSAALNRMAATEIEMPLLIGGRRIETGRFARASIPHDHARSLGRAHLAGADEVRAAISEANRARHDWSRQSWQERAGVFLRAADLLAGPWRDTLNAATMLGQSKTVHQAEIDAAAELADFWRFNAAYMLRLYAEQPASSPGTWNRVDYRPLDGFVLALTPFNFTAIAGNLPSAPALLGNTVVWKPAANAMVAAHYVMELLRAAGLPDGVINLVNGDAAEVAGIALDDPTLAGVHFTGSTAVFDGILHIVGKHSSRYRSYPRVVGETGGKNFMVAHASADPASLAAAILRGAYEYQGQKCSAASRLFIPRSLWPELHQRLCDEIGTIRVGDVADFRTFMGAVIDERAWTRHDRAIAAARDAAATRVLAGGGTDRSRGWFVEPTLIETDDAASPLLCDELFGPIAAALVYPDERFEEVLRHVDEGSAYGLTGSIFARDRRAVARASDALRDAAGNFYVNDKPTGAVVGQQPFGGGRRSGTNDKAGSPWNLLRWASPRTIKETAVPSTDYRYPSMAEDPAEAHPAQTA